MAVPSMLRLAISFDLLPVLRLAHESFSYPETQPLFRQLEELSRRSGLSRGAAFEDFLTAAVCALAAETKEDEYLAMIERHKAGRVGQRGADLLAQMFASLVNAMERSDGDILGDLFQSAVSHQESGQFFTPPAVSQLMSELTFSGEERDEGTPLLVSDPACGTGRMLLDAARQNSNVELVGTDIDARCAKISAINIGLRQRYGWVVCGNSLTLEHRFAYRIAPFFHESPNGRRRGVIRDVPIEQTPVFATTSATGRSARDLFEHDAGDDSPQPTAPLDEAPTILEIPRWILKFERLFSVREPESESDETSPDSPAPREEPQLPPSTDRKTQGELF